MSLATAFLDRFRAAERADSPLEILGDDPDGWGAALKEQPHELYRAFGDAIGKDFGSIVTLNRDCFATAACDEGGAIVAADPGFQGWFDKVDPFDAVVRGLGNDTPKVSMLADDVNGRPIALVAGRWAMVRSWPLSRAVRDALDSGMGCYAIAAFRSGELSWDRTAQAYGLTQAESGLVFALARLGDLQRAAKERGVSYETARKFVAAALKKTGAKRQTELVRLALMLTAGEIPDAQNLAAVVRDLFGLTERQAQLAVIVSQGMTRERAAQVLGISESSAKDGLKSVYQACGVENAVDLARLVAEVNALKGLASACDVNFAPSGHEGEPLRLIPRRWTDGRIAIADHGPANGKPVLVMHSTVSGRHHPARFIKRLKAEGFRPITMDRAGFGLTDRTEAHPIEAGINDIADVLSALGLKDIIVVARCTAASAIACGAGARGLVKGGILVWPDAPARHTAPERRGMTDRARQIFAHHPALAAPFVQMLCRRTSNKIIEKHWRYAARNVSADIAVLDDDVLRAEIIRSSRQALQGFHGFLSEALADAQGFDVHVPNDSSQWTGLFGTGYESYDVDDALDFWRKCLPQGTLKVVDDGVHFLHITHLDEIVAALKRASS